MNLDLIIENLALRGFGLLKIPMIFACRPTIISMDDQQVTIKLPLTWFTKNHHGSMYFGALAVGADLGVGILAMRFIKKSKVSISLIFKDFSAEFLKRPEADVYFHCKAGEQIQTLVKVASNSNERQFLGVEIDAYMNMPDHKTTLGGNHEPVAKFKLTLALKKKKQR